jgi:glutamine transport system permease protein
VRDLDSGTLEIIFDAMPMLIEGVKLTVVYSVAAIIPATIVGLIFALLKLSSLGFLRRVGEVYVHVFRGLPLLVVIFYIYFALPQLLPMHAWFGDSYRFIAAIIALTLNEGAYITEIIRAGILSIDQGQTEAAYSIGMNKFQSMRFIILPQAFKRMIPPLMNQFIQTIKDTSLLSAISVAELTRQGQIYISTSFAAIQIWTAVAIMYLIVILSLTAVSSKLERRWQIDKR